ncbi:glycosyltransferase family 2 protein [Thomasclavelia sp.]|uniref:glycosyltransferase family 2 protein n=1 Tax=Thomasclavelia sp. TaxID=3025757 RepID=UPI0025E0D424|nr:glycosyltransferase family 2 protein [Thomasclavelia sp.]
MDKVSVVVPVFNKEKELKRCLNSIVKQTYNNIEIIIVDDGSTDNSYKIYTEFANKDKRIRIVKKKMKALILPDILE